MLDFSNEKKFRKAFRKRTKIVWLESPTNPTLKIFDIRKIGKICKEKGALLVIDNTFSTPLN